MIHLRSDVSSEMSDVQQEQYDTCVSSEMSDIQDVRSTGGNRMTYLRCQMYNRRAQDDTCVTRKGQVTTADPGPKPAAQKHPVAVSVPVCCPVSQFGSVWPCVKVCGSVWQQCGSVAVSVAHLLNLNNALNNSWLRKIFRNYLKKIKQFLTIPFKSPQLLKVHKKLR